MWPEKPVKDRFDVESHSARTGQSDLDLSSQSLAETIPAKKDFVRDELYTSHRLNDSRIKYFWRASQFIDSLGEARGVNRQPPDERRKANLSHFLQITAIWSGGVCSLPSMTGFFSGSLLFGLGFKSSTSAALFGTFLGSVIAAFGAVMGPRSGMRAMIGSKFYFGWWPAKFMALLNCLTIIGWAIINSVFGGQVLSALSNETMSIEIGILIVFIISLIISVLGMRVLGIFDKIMMGPVVIAFLLCYVCTAHGYDTHTPSDSPGTLAGWLTFFQSCVGITSTWVGLGADYYVDLPEDTNRWLVYFFTLAAIWLPTVFAGMIGIGLSSAARTNPVLNDVYNKLGGGGLIVHSMNRWGGGGKFLVVLMFLSLITNTIFSNYSLALSAQVFGKPFARTPRYVFSIIGSVIYYVLSAVGKDSYSTVIENFLPMIGYWSMMFGSIMIIETVWFRRDPANEYKWSEHENPKHFPIMYAAVTAFCIGIAGCVVGMDQYYFVGPLAKVIKPHGAELGTLLATGFSAVSYIILRTIELKLRKGPIAP